MILHPEAVPDNLLEVEPAPAHDAVAVRPRLDDLRQRHPLHRRQLRNRAGRFVVVQALGACLIEPGHPVAQALAVHAANRRRIPTVQSS